MSTASPTVSLVLGSGGARGLAHIGVIREIERRGYRVRSIAGCSIGALVGGIYAAGKLDRFEHWVSGISRFDILSLLDLAWGWHGLVKGDRIINKLVDLVGDVRIEDLPMPYTAVATDIVRGSEVWLSSGRLFDAIRASISLPLLFTPFRHRDRLLIDGGVLNPVPIAPTFADGTDLTIAVNLGGPPAAAPVTKPAPPPPSSAASTVHAWVERLVGDVEETPSEDRDDDWGAYEIANLAFDAMQETIARQKLAAYPPDRLIEIPRNACGVLEFERAREMIELGAATARASLGVSS